MSAVRSSGQRGFSLLEVMVALGAMAFVLAGVVGVVRVQQQSYVDGQRLREAQGSARNALLHLEQVVATAGFGMAPSLAIDLDRYTGKCPDTFGAPCARDALATPDELVVLSRDIEYWVPADPTREPRGHAWRLLAAPDPSTLRISARQGDAFLKGQIVQVVCQGASFYAYATLSARVAPLAADGPADLKLAGTSEGDPFRRQDLAADACFTDGTARVFLVNRSRFHVRPVAVSEPWRYDPYLVLDTGRDVNGDGAIDEQDEVIVGAFIEDMQVAYQLAGGSTAGATPGTRITLAGGYPGSTGTTDRLTTLVFPGPDAADGESRYSPTSWYRFALGPPQAPERDTDHQANIRAIRLSLTARSPRADLQLQGRLHALRLNATGTPAWADPGGTGRDGFERASFETTISLPNMVVQGMTFF